MIFHQALEVQNVRSAPWCFPRAWGREEDRLICWLESTTTQGDISLYTLSFKQIQTVSFYCSNSLSVSWGLLWTLKILLKGLWVLYNFNYTSVWGQIIITYFTQKNFKIKVWIKSLMRILLNETLKRYLQKDKTMPLFSLMFLFYKIFGSESELVVEHLSSMFTAQGLIPNTAKKKKKTKTHCGSGGITQGLVYIKP